MSSSDLQGEYMAGIVLMGDGIVIPWGDRKNMIFQKRGAERSNQKSSSVKLWNGHSQYLNETSM